MIYRLNKSVGHTFCRATGICLAASMMTAMFTLCCGTRSGGVSFTADSTAKISSPSGFTVNEITISEPSVPLSKDPEKNEKAYEKLIREKRKKNRRKTTTARAEETQSASTTASPEQTQGASTTAFPEETQSTTATTESDLTEMTTFVTTVPSQTSPTTAAVHEEQQEEENTPSVSNGMEPFNYNDVSSIAFHLNTLGDFADEIQPFLISWNAEEYAENGCVEITMDSDCGSVVLDVKALDNTALGVEPSGSVSGSAILSWEWLSANRTAGCNISSVIWKDAAFSIRPVRGIEIGSTLAGLTDNYLCVNGGANTLYKASDVIEDQSKLNAILAAENIYTFVGGRVYSIGSYLDKYYSGREHTFLFEDCDYVVQYGCNSIMDHNYTTGSWIIEYAVREDKVIGIIFMNKSYYNNESRTALSTNNASSGMDPAVVTTRTEIISAADCDNEKKPEDVVSSECENEQSGTTATDDQSSPDRLSPAGRPFLTDESSPAVKPSSADEPSPTDNPSSADNPSPADEPNPAE